MLHSSVYLRHVEGSTLAVDENANGRRISEEAERVHRQENKTQAHCIRQHLSIQINSHLD